jgi:hypothetical protein
VIHPDATLCDNVGSASNAASKVALLRMVLTSSIRCGLTSEFVRNILTVRESLTRDELR